MTGFTGRGAICHDPVQALVGKALGICLDRLSMKF
jgi:hypothetical protein